MNERGENRGSSLTAGLAALRSGVLPLIVLAFVGTILVYPGTFLAMADIWLRSDTFAHGLIVLPIFIYLIFRNRHELAGLRAQPFWPGLVLLLGLGVIWATGRYLGVNALEQFAAVAMIPGAVLTMAGPRVIHATAFPMLFLFFAVPFGEFLIPLLMEVTADMTTLFLQLTGFPVYRTGLFIAVPGGDFEIAKACSGIRYLIASVVLGTIFAYLTFNKWRKRLIFIAIATIVPIVANGIRAYMIVVLASLSGMKLAVGVDHFIYGWVFFGIVMFILFGVGVRYRDDEPEAAGRASAVTGPVAVSRSTIVVALATLVALLIGPATLGLAKARKNTVPVVALAAPPAGWSVVTAEGPWQPYFRASDQSLRRAVSDGQDTVYEFVDIYDSSNGGMDAAGSANRLVDNDLWRIEAVLPQSDSDKRLVSIFSNRQKMFLATWYQNGQRRNASPSKAKIVEALDTLIHGGRVSALLVYAIDGDDPENLEKLLAFLEQYEPQITRCIAGADCDD
ncbi:MAG: exosortase A [Gammaproteobacteria bacterium]|nr:exosortase A [Gammaproteobacteria bacterium]